MAAYGLYTHIASNKFRSMLLLAGLFVLIYVMVYAGALIAEVVINSGGPVNYYLAKAARDLVTAFPYATGVAVQVWTVNETADMERLLDWGVDGLISDRPDRAVEVVRRRHAT